VSAVQLELLIATARQRLPSGHRALLEQLGVQDVVVDDWPLGVQALYETLRERPPTTDELGGAIAAWLPQRRVVAFNARLLRHALAGDELNDASRQAAIDNIAWHEYGHALSAVLASPETKALGPSLVELLPLGLRRAIDYPGGYSRGQVFDEVIANVYALMIGRVVHLNDYRFPEFLHRDIVKAFQDVVPWPPSR
jgi:hypothetical protein